VVLGYQGIRQFSNIQAKSNRKLIQKGQSSTQLPSHVRQLNAGDYFYNGQEVLSNVKDWHKMLRSALWKMINYKSSPRYG
jgi:hypothetical protein